jgi:dipeptidyl aminopeptidase/acylaminoacyl peptidase
MKIPIVLLAALLLCMRLDAQKNTSYQFEIPPDTSALYKEGTVNTFLNERDFAISPDGNEIYFTISTPRSSIQTIVFAKKNSSGKWSKPEVVSFAGSYSDLEPAFSADGETMYFASNRPINANGALKDFDIWKVSRQGSNWGTPVNLGTTINTEADEFYPSVSKSGNLYFTAAYAGGPGKEDIYVSAFKENAFQKPVPLDTAVNSPKFEFNAFVAPDENYILFSSFGRKDEKGGGDLYISTKDPHGKWLPAQNVKELNSPRLDYCPYVSPDGKALFFTSDRHQLPISYSDTRASYQTIVDEWKKVMNGNGNIFWVKFDMLKKYFADLNAKPNK